MIRVTDRACKINHSEARAYEYSERICSDFSDGDGRSLPSMTSRSNSWVSTRRSQAVWRGQQHSIVQDIRATATAVAEVAGAIAKWSFRTF